MDNTNLKQSMTESLLEFNTMLSRLNAAIETIERASEDLITALHDKEESLPSPPAQPLKQRPPGLSHGDLGLIFLFMLIVSVMTAFFMTYF